MKEYPPYNMRKYIAGTDSLWRLFEKVYEFRHGHLPDADDEEDFQYFLAGFIASNDEERGIKSPWDGGK